MEHPLLRCDGTGPAGLDNCTGPGLYHHDKQDLIIIIIIALLAWIIALALVCILYHHN